MDAIETCWLREETCTAEILIEGLRGDILLLEGLLDYYTDKQWRKP